MSGRWSWWLLRYRICAWFRGLSQTIAWWLPRSVVAWCYIRVVAHATTGKYQDTVVPKLDVFTALRRWDEQ